MASSCASAWIKTQASVGVTSFHVAQGLQDLLNVPLNLDIFEYSGDTAAFAHENRHTIHELLARIGYPDRNPEGLRKLASLPLGLEGSNGTCQQH